MWSTGPLDDSLKRNEDITPCETRVPFMSVDTLDLPEISYSVSEVLQ